MRDVREAVITEIDRLPTADTSANGFGRDESQARTPGFSPLTIIDLMWVERSFLFRSLLTALLVSTVIAFLLPNHYTATTRLMPPGYGASSAMALALPALSDRAGSGGGGEGSVMGLASQLLGMNTSGELYVGVIQSQVAEDRVIEKLGLMSVYRNKYREDARKQLESNTSISIGARTGIISISVTDKKPERAAAIAKAYVIELNQVLSEVNSSSAHREVVFLAERLQEIKQRSEADAKEFALFASQNAAVDIPNQAKAMVTAEAELQSQLIVAESELKGLRQIYAVGNARVRAAQARLDELQRQANKFGGKDVDPAKDASLANDELYPSLRQLPLLGVKYLDLYRRARIEDAVFELLTKEYEIAKIQEAREVPTAEVLDAATLPEKKSSPHRLVLMLEGAFSGFVFACAYLVGCTVWKHTEFSDPRKVLAQEVFSTVRVWIERTPVLRRLYAGLRRVAVWLPRPADRRSA